MTFFNPSGYLTRLPLRAPNANPKVPTTISTMVAILTDPTASEKFRLALASDDSYGNDCREEGLPSALYSESAGLMKELIKSSNRSIYHVKAIGILGHIVNPGCLSFCKLDGKTFAVTQGRWLLTNVKAAWIAKNVPIDQNKIQIANSQILIIRVPPGSVGCILEQGTEVLLDTGTHVFNSGTVAHVSTLQYANQETFSHGQYSYVRVHRGKFARVWVDVKGPDQKKSIQPRLLQEGEHFIDSHLFKFDGMSNVSDVYIKHGSVHRISVQKGFVAKVNHDNTPRLLGEGDHLVESTHFSFEGTEDIIKNSWIRHGTMTILRVTLGQIALCWQNNEPAFIDKPGLYEFDSPDFAFVELKDAEQPFIQLGARKIVLCQTGNVAVTFDNGELKILSDGRHIINSSTHIFHRFLSIQQRSIRLSTLSGS
jgi:hypothetical protein